METTQAPAPERPEPPFERHVLNRTVVLPELKVLFLPVPKAGCTGVLWRLAELAGLPAERFTQSASPEVSPALTVHDMRLWRPEHRLSEYEGAERERLLGEDGWLRFSLVRHPGTRLWSAWQSKLLLREPRFVEAFGEAPWFPRMPESPEQVVEDFRAFVAALGDDGPEDVHWAVQHDLTGQLPLNHVGRVEALGETLDVLRDHVGADRFPRDGARENRSPLSMPPDAYDAPARATLGERYEPDFDGFGYEPLPAGEADGWGERIAPALGLLRASIEEHARIGQLHRIAQRRLARVRDVEEKLESTSANKVGHARSPVLTNLEGETDFNVRWAWAEQPLATGFTGVVRVKDEARSLPFVLPQLLRATERVVLVDNGSTDGTPDVAREVAAAHGAADRLEVHEYPFAVSRCGEEHLGTPQMSVHNLAYFYNWSFAHVRTTYALKWDGDMVLTDAAVLALRDLAWQLEAARAILRVPRYPLYLAPGGRRAYVDVALRNNEPWAWPNQPGWSFVKAMEWELPLWADDVPTLTLPDWGCVEIKHLDEDEFAHWSPTDFEASARTRRKRREWEVFHALQGGGAPPEDVVAVDAPEGVHVIDHVRDVWLPARAAAKRR